jgi:hypothetical protein
MYPTAHDEWRLTVRGSVAVVTNREPNPIEIRRSRD